MKNSKKHNELTDSQKISIGLLGILFSFIFLIISLFFEMQGQYIVFAVFLTLSLWTIFVGILMIFTRLVLRSLIYATCYTLLLILPFVCTIPFVINRSQDILSLVIMFDLTASSFLLFLFYCFAVFMPRNRNMKFLSTNEDKIKQTYEIQTSFSAILFNEKGDRGLIIKINPFKHIVKIEKLIEGGYYIGTAEYFAATLLEAKVLTFRELLTLEQDGRENIKINTELPSDEKLKELMIYFNKKLHEDAFEENFLTNSSYSTYYKKEYIYLTNKKDKTMSIEIHNDFGNLYFCLLGIREQLGNIDKKEDIYEIIKLVLQGNLIYVLSGQKTNIYANRTYDVYDLRKLNFVPKFVRFKILHSKNTKTWTQITAREYLANQKKQKRKIFDIGLYADALNEKLQKNGIKEKFEPERKLIKGRIKECLHVSNSSNLLKQADIFIAKNQFNFRFVFSFITAPVLLDFESNVQIMYDFVSQLFTDKVVFHYKMSPEGKMYEKGMFLLDKNNEFKESIVTYLTNNSNVRLMVWSETDKMIIMNQMNEVFK